MKTKHWTIGRLTPHDSFAILYNAIQRGIDTGLIQPGEGVTTMEIAYGMWALPHGAATLQVKYLQGMAMNFERADRFAIETFVRALVKDNVHSA